MVASHHIPQFVSLEKIVILLGSFINFTLPLFFVTLIVRSVEGPIFIVVLKVSLNIFHYQLPVDEIGADQREVVPLLLARQLACARIFQRVETVIDVSSRVVLIPQHSMHV